MNRLSLLTVGVVLALEASASTTTCPNATYDNYLAANFSCTSGNLAFSNFGYAPTANPSTNAIPAASIFVTALTTDWNEGFQFSSGWFVGTPPVSQFQDSLITYDVKTVDGGNTITDLHLFFNGSVSGTGLSNVIENYCKGGSLISCAPGQLGQLSATNPPLKLSDAVTFDGVNRLSISKDIQVNTGIGPNGTASISQVVNSYSQVPEPVSYLLFGTGLVAFGLLKRNNQAC